MNGSCAHCSRAWRCRGRGRQEKLNGVDPQAWLTDVLARITDHDLPIAQDELFGPVLVIQAFDTEAEAIALANNSHYGLAASVWSTNVDRPLRIARKSEAGTVWFNN